ncbi:Hypothetical predicted protein [Paramuricea clavata]|uniref:Uncharacterized protein n=1 Tax=Paramuricea clavata TaxID=317549 RepID=A0A7D9J4T8_PARCT|nr:Hypothetical predicted protein [Paramuricea clavata]
MGMIKILDSDQKRRVNVVTARCDPLLQEFSDVFESLGKLEVQYTIVTDPSASPFASRINRSSPRKA